MSLKSLERYAESDAMMEKFNQMEGTDDRAELFESERDYREVIAERFGKYKIESLDINSELQDFGPAFYGEGIMFSSNRTGDILNTRTHKWNGQPFLDIYVTGTPNVMNPEIRRFNEVEANTKYHESTSVFNAANDVVFFTRNNYVKGKIGKDEEDVIRLQVFRSNKRDNGWSLPVPLPFNSDAYSVAHPSLSPDGNTLYFTSDMPGTKGGADIWKVAILGEASYGTPENLGEIVNTDGRESFPFVSKENSLYYATDGIPGLGGLDIHAIGLNSAGMPVGGPVNVGEPVNSPADDFSFIIDEVANRGYFASNREGGKGYDDIYGVMDTGRRSTTTAGAIDPGCKQSIGGVVTDEDSGERIPFADVSLLDSNGSVVATQMADANGRYRFFSTNCNQLYRIRATKESYSIAEASLQTGTSNGMSFDKDLAVDRKMGFTTGDDLAKQLNLNPIYFDFDKSNIRPDAAYELTKVLAVMKQYPNLEIDVRSHTDSRAPDDYNMALSKRRNKSTVQWLVNKGINSNRLTGDGYGETQLVNNCGNGANCTEAQHQKNRRSEFIVVKQ